MPMLTRLVAAFALAATLAGCGSDLSPRYALPKHAVIDGSAHAAPETMPSSAGSLPSGF